MLEISAAQIAKFWSKVSKVGDCLEHSAKSTSNGWYPRLHFRLTDGVKIDIDAHRLSWIIHHKWVPEGYLICHKCDNPKCVNPEHLFLGTHTDNMHDMIYKGRQGNVFTEEERCKANSPEAISKKLKTYSAIKHQQGFRNSQFGSMWITNGYDCKTIKKESIIPEGWYKGRIMHPKG